MFSKRVYVFGYGKFGQALSTMLNEYRINFFIGSNCQKEQSILKEFRENSFCFDLEDEKSLENLEVDENTIFVCAMDNNHENLFLALTLRELFPKNYILAISDSIYLTNKLKMAGVNRVIDIYSISGNIMLNILKNPIATRFLQGFINKEHDIIFKEVKILKDSPLVGKKINEIDFDEYDIIFIGMIDEANGNQFIFRTTGANFEVNSGDVLVFLGREQNLFKFQLECAGGKN